MGVEPIGGRSAGAVHYQQCFIPDFLSTINIAHGVENVKSIKNSDLQLPTP